MSTEYYYKEFVESRNAITLNNVYVRDYIKCLNSVQLTGCKVGHVSAESFIKMQSSQAFDIASLLGITLDNCVVSDISSAGNVSMNTSLAHFVHAKYLSAIKCNFLGYLETDIEMNLIESNAISINSKEKVCLADSHASGFIDSECIELIRSSAKIAHATKKISLDHAKVSQKVNTTEVSKCQNSIISGWLICSNSDLDIVNSKIEKVFLSNNTLPQKINLIDSEVGSITFEKKLGLINIKGNSPKPRVNVGYDYDDEDSDIDI